MRRVVPRSRRIQALSAKSLDQRVEVLPSKARPGAVPAFSLPEAVAAEGVAA